MQLRYKPGARQGDLAIAEKVNLTPLFVNLTPLLLQSWSSPRALRRSLVCTFHHRSGHHSCWIGVI